MAALGDTAGFRSKGALWIVETVINSDDNTATFTLSSGTTVTLSYTKGRVRDYSYNCNTQCLILEEGQLIHVISLDAGEGIEKYLITESPYLARLFSDQASIALPNWKVCEAEAAAEALGGIIDFRSHGDFQIVDAVINPDGTVTCALSGGESCTLWYTEGSLNAYSYYCNTQCLILDNGRLIHVIKLGVDEGLESYPIIKSPYLARLFSEQLIAPEKAEILQPPL